MLFDDYTGSTSGFSSYVRESDDAYGETDFVLWNGNAQNIGRGAKRYAGVVPSASGTPLVNEFLVSAADQLTTLYPGPTPDQLDFVNSSIGPDDILEIVEVFLEYPTVTYVFELDHFSGGADIDLALYDMNGDYFAKDEFLVSSFNSGAGIDEAFAFQPPEVGFYALVVWKKDYTDYQDAASFTVRAKGGGVPLPNLIATQTPSGWTFPIVPRNTPDATSNSALLPFELLGDPTYFNQSTEVIGVPSGNWTTRVWMDGEPLSSGAVGNPVPGTYLTLNQGPFAIHGGRHTIASVVNLQPNEVLETTYSDNVWSNQWVWRPEPLSKENGILFTRMPPWEGSGIHPNSDAFSFSRDPGHAWVVGVSPSVQNHDMDLIVYDDYSFSTTGLSSIVDFSLGGGSFTDFVVGHYDQTPTTLYPAVFRIQPLPDPTGYLIDQSDALNRVGGEEAEWLDVFQGSDRIADVYEADLLAGETYYMELEIRSPADVDLRFVVFPSDPGETYSVFDGTFSGSVRDSLESLMFTPAASGRHPVVVYRISGPDVGSDLQYDLRWSKSGIVAVEPPSNETFKFAFSGVHPNPVVHNARVDFTLPQSQQVRIELYDIRGRRVKTLADTKLEAGPHRMLWSGDLDGGGQAAAGVYWVRLRAGQNEEVRRIAVVR